MLRAGRGFRRLRDGVQRCSTCPGARMRAFREKIAKDPSYSELAAKRDTVPYLNQQAIRKGAQRRSDGASKLLNSPKRGSGYAALFALPCSSPFLPREKSPVTWAD